MNAPLHDLFERAMREGKQIDLAGCCYGEPHWQGDFVREPSSYYCLLAGLVRTQQLTRVLELGTHFGGAIMAMSRGLHPNEVDHARLVTVDVTCKNIEGFKAYPHIRRVIGDCFDRRVLAQVAASFDRGIDLLFIDTVHEYRQTYCSLALYANRLRPHYIVLDDIHLNPSMERLWRRLQLRLGEHALDLSALCERRKPGLGVLVTDPAQTWQQKYGFWRYYWRLRRVVSTAVPRGRKD